MTAFADTEVRGDEESDDRLALTDLDLPPEDADEVRAGRRDMGSARGLAGRGGACEEWGCGMNHNEALSVTPDSADDEVELDDLDLPDEHAENVKAGARGGPCDDWGCGMNHNEAMAVTS